MSLEETNAIYKMKLHEQIGNAGMNITRVAGGWIYDFVPYNGFNGGVIFVPYDNDMHVKEAE